MIRLSIDQQVELMDQDGLPPFSKLWLLGEDGRYMSDNRLTDAYDDALSAMIEGHDDALRAEVLRTLREGESTLIDRITAELAAEACCDPLTALAIAMQLDADAIIEDASTDDLVMLVDVSSPSDSDGNQTAVWVAPGILWYARGTVVAPLPEIALAAAVDRRLRDVISHPVLDRFNLTILGVTEDEVGRAVFETDAIRTPLDVDRLAAIRPPGAGNKGIIA